MVDVLGLVLWGLLALTDPAGDVPPPGYAWPQAAVYREVGFADLVGFRLEERKGRLWVGFALDRTPNPAGAPHGFSLVVLADYVDTGPGGVAVLPGAGFRVPKGREADLVVVATGWGARAYPLKGGRPVRRAMRREGRWIWVDTGLPPGRYRHYPVVGIYDPFAPLGFRQPSPAGGLWRPKAPAGSPAAVDVLDPGAYARGVLYPASFLRPYLPALFAAGAALVFFLWGVGGVLRGRRRAAR